MTTEAPKCGRITAVPASETGHNLEDRLSAPITLETDLLDFVAMAGLYRWVPLYLEGPPYIRNAIKTVWKGRHDTFSSEEKKLCTRFMHGLERYYFEAGGGVSLGDFKTTLETRGIPVDQMGFKGLAFFNDILREYKIEPVKIRTQYHTQNYLNKYGLMRSQV